MYPIYISLISMSPKFNSFRPTAIHFQVGEHFERSELHDPKMAWKHVSSKVPPYTCYIYPRIQNFHSVSLNGQAFSSYRPFWNKCTEWPQHDHKQYKINGTHIHITPIIPKFHPTSLYGKSLSRHRAFWHNGTERTQNDLQISIRFALRPALFELQAILKEVHLMTTNDIEYYNVKDILHTYYNYPESQISLPFCPMVLQFRVTGYLRQVHQMTPKWH